MKDLEIVSRALNEGDYTIAYLEGLPVAIYETDEGGSYGIVYDGEFVYNPVSNRCWLVDDDSWSCVKVESVSQLSSYKDYDDHRRFDGDYKGQLEDWRPA